jgi:hypothetical protein
MRIFFSTGVRPDIACDDFVARDPKKLEQLLLLKKKKSIIA